MKRSDLLVWMDLEMTSVQDVLKDKIIEIAIIVTDADLAIVAEGPDIVIHASEEDFEGIPSEVKEMHDVSGIKKASIESDISLKEAEAQVLAFLKQYIEPQSSPLCGNSIHMDRHFLRIHMPAVDAYLHYRCIDVSILKELGKRWSPSVGEFQKKKTHRAKDDIIESIEELKFWRREILKQ
ncbi:oligoribonuclease [Candidatus Kaiserbacteria bacterium CG10_big_fil_rev_8_21_14_0_10_45_20]|uniref:Oligoribonuclease n=1 Tax=Candidatus Kaiserbacteria bacterium CG10_big_fil_rev_8_21_14_0_10_45_20 TaxID=1974607 RepID=A0A2H0UFR6_9BACT|nr:MAG: oligoribonuclease [Candidatus Kaiserbacteria bacterium CG10_big_fil_rev_8_21_14_0_10_45_20]